MAETQTKFDPLALVTEAPREKDPTVRWFTADPAVIYPATIGRIKEFLAAEPGQTIIDRLGVPEELIGSDSPEADPIAAARMLVRKARQLGGDLDLVLVPKSEAREGNMEPSRLQARAAALEVARLWFTRALSLAVGGCLGLRITKNDDWRL